LQHRWSSLGRMLKLSIGADYIALKIEDCGQTKSFEIDRGFVATLSVGIDQVCSELGPYEARLTSELALVADPHGFALTDHRCKFVFPTLSDLERFQDRVSEILGR